MLEVKKSLSIINFLLSGPVQRSGKKFGNVNDYLEQHKFKYEDWKVGLSYFQKDAYILSFDLKSEYHHIGIHADYEKFLGFAWSFSNSGQRRYFVFTVLPFGLSTASYIFTKMLKPLVKYWRINGLKLGLFLDDGWIIIIIEKGRDTYIQSRIGKHAVRHRPSRIHNKKEKCHWEPSQVMEWLGTNWDYLHNR